jgi:hypothetical protein
MARATPIRAAAAADPEPPRAKPVVAALTSGVGPHHSGCLTAAAAQARMLSWGTKHMHPGLPSSRGRQYKELVDVVVAKHVPSLAGVQSACEPHCVMVLE